jgi:hypothetical protein
MSASTALAVEQLRGDYEASTPSLATAQQLLKDTKSLMRSSIDL